jgi:hypothetical protein
VEQVLHHPTNPVTQALVAAARRTSWRAPKPAEAAGWGS